MGGASAIIAAATQDTVRASTGMGRAGISKGYRCSVIRSYTVSIRNCISPGSRTVSRCRNTASFIGVTAGQSTRRTGAGFSIMASIRRNSNIAERLGFAQISGYTASVGDSSSPRRSTIIGWSGGCRKIWRPSAGARVRFCT